MVTALALALTAGTAWISMPGDQAPLQVGTVEIALEGGGIRTLLEWPIVIGEASDPAVDAINEALAWETVTGEPIEETMAIYSEIQRGHTGAGYVVNWNRNGILDLTIRLDYLGAYPSTNHRYFCFNAATGEPVIFSDLLLPGGAEALAQRLDSMLAENIAACMMPDRVDPAIYQGYTFEVGNLDSFSITGDGVWFHYDFGFPHAALAAEPDGELFLPSAEIIPFLAEPYR